MKSSELVRILVVDDHAIVREGLRVVINLEKDLEVVGEAADGVDAIEKFRLLQPDVVLMDLLMPRLGGLEAIRAILEDNPDARILVITSFADMDKILPSIKAGALGYVVKNSDPSVLITAIHDVAQGAVYMQAEIARQLFHSLSQRDDVRQPSLDQLSSRELDVLKLVARGMTNDEIAKQLMISQSTVGVHVNHILEKLELTNRTQAALFALRSGLVSLFPDELS
jgi:NarL family two-component system response regulator LiaR